MGYVVMETPVGPLTIISDNGRLRSLSFGRKVSSGAMPDAGANALVVAQLEEYFSGARRDFDLGLDLIGTPFQQSVWRALQDIPYGETRSYGEIARVIGKSRAARAVGMANNRNPISIIVPCHRVIGADGSLVGYGGGLDIKTSLLALEGTFRSKRAQATRSRGRSTPPQPALFS